eukprot:scaffold685_cov324-Prasinococcus_capsulatus_cf.AAC.8
MAAGASGLPRASIPRAPHLSGRLRTSQVSGKSLAQLRHPRCDRLRVVKHPRHVALDVVPGHSRPRRHVARRTEWGGSYVGPGPRAETALPHAPDSTRSRGSARARAGRRPPPRAPPLVEPLPSRRAVHAHVCACPRLDSATAAPRGGARQ